MQPEHIKQMNEHYRSKAEPSDVHKEAFEQVLKTGTVTLDHVDEMVDALYEPFPDSKKDTPVDPFEPTLPTKDEGNGLGRAVTKDYAHGRIYLHISEKLWKMQPIGVLLRPINDEVRRAGEALVTDVAPRSADVEAEVMPCYHYKLTIEPTPVWLAKWMGENGYPTIE